MIVIPFLVIGILYRFADLLACANMVGKPSALGVTWTWRHVRDKTLWLLAWCITLASLFMAS